MPSARAQFPLTEGSADHPSNRCDICFRPNSAFSVDDAGLPQVSQLPSDLESLQNLEARSLNNANWDVVSNELIAAIEHVLSASVGVVDG
jgi:hypothetical protein